MHSVPGDNLWELSCPIRIRLCISELWGIPGGLEAVETKFGPKMFFLMSPLYGFIPILFAALGGVVIFMLGYIALNVVYFSVMACRALGQWLIIRVDRANVDDKQG